MKQIKKIREKLARHELVMGTHIKTPDPSITEFFALRGVDFVWIDGEHIKMTGDIIYGHTLAAQAHGTAAIYRVPWNKPEYAKPVLDMGIDGIVFPMICTKEDAELAVASCTYPPKGIRGLGPIRDDGYGLIPPEEQLKSAEDVWKVMQIEHYKGIENLDAILDVEGVDAIVVGSSDLSASLGIPTQTQHPEVLRLQDELAEKCKKKNVPFAISCVYNPQVVKQWMDRGIDWISIGGEYNYMDMGYRQATDDIIAQWNARK